MLEAFGNWLGTFEGHRLMNAFDWLWPLCEIIHFIGMAMLIGALGILDLRILGFAKGLSISRLEALVPVAIWGFVANLVTGIMFVACNAVGGPNAYLLNLAFQIKMVLIALAGINALAFYVTGLPQSLAALGPAGEAAGRAKFIAGASLALWIGVIIFGRLVMYNDTLLWFLGL